MLGITVVICVIMCVMNSRYEKTAFPVEVFAQIIDYEEYATDEDGKQYVAVFKYTYDGEEYIVKDTRRKFREEDSRYKYDIITLRINPKRPEQFIV